MSVLKIQEGQSVFDVILQEFGTLENIGDFLTDNPTLTVNDELESGDEVEINSDNLGDEDIKTRFVKISFVTNNKDTNFIESVQDQFQFQNGDAFDFQNGDAFEFN